MKARIIPIALSSLFILSTAYSAGTASDYPIAGATPWQRPAGAPTVEFVKRELEWFQRSLTGINRPYPPSLYFLDNQGYWYTPFVQQGMLPPYDLRGWHQ